LNALPGYGAQPSHCSIHFLVLTEQEIDDLVTLLA
jgi:hypothetical protein